MGRHIPSLPATSALEGRLRLVSHASSQPGQTPDLLTETQTSVGQQGSQIPSQPGQAAGSPGLALIPASLPWRQRTTVGNWVLEGVASFYISPHLHPEFTLKVENATWEQGTDSSGWGSGSGVSLAMPAEHVRWGWSLTPLSVARGTRTTLGKAAPCTTPVFPVKPRHSPCQNTPCRWEHSTHVDSQLLPASCV